MTNCRTPFAHNPQSCDCTPGEFAARRDEINARMRRDMVRASRQSLAIAAVAFLSLMAVGYVAAAIIDQGRENIKEWMVQNERV